MSEDQLDVTAAEPKTYDRIVYESLDPPREQEPAPFDSSPAGLEEAANTRLNGAERNVVDVLQFKDPKTGEVHDGDKIASKEFAADELTRHRAARAVAEAAALDAEMIAALDAHRAQSSTERMADELTAPLDQPAEQHEPQPVEQPQPEFPQEPSLSPELAQAFSDPEFVAKAMRHPGLQAEVSRLVQGVENVRQQHAQAVINAGTMAMAGLAASFPEFQSVSTNEQLVGAINMMRQMNPQRYEALSNHYAKVSNIIAQAQQVQQQQVSEQQFKERIAWDQFAKAEDAKVDKFLANETPTQRAVLQQEVVAMLNEEGLSNEHIGYLWNNDAAFRRSISQKTLVRAAKHRIAERAIRASRSTPIPQVQRPGVSEPRADYSELTSVQNRFNAAPTKELAAALIQARRSARR
jgi:hypothetical protein